MAKIRIKRRLRNFMTNAVAGGHEQALSISINGNNFEKESINWKYNWGSDEQDFK